MNTAKENHGPRGQKFLRELATTPEFDTSTVQIMERFYVPALSRSTSYDRGVGYFTSNWMRMAAAGLAELAANGGTARILASPKLTPEDVAALAQGDAALTDETVKKSLELSLAELAAALETETLSAIAWMVADGLLQFRVACPVNDLDGDFHDKFGIFSDASGAAIAFNGSPNDSEKAFRNYESISVFYSWIDDREKARVEGQKDRFKRLWENQDANIRAYEMPDAIKQNLIEFRNRAPRPYTPPKRLAEDRRWRHQKEALAAFLAAQHGVLEMATGTGKTRTAIAILNELYERRTATTSIVATYGTDLLDQWYKVLAPVGHPVYRAYDRHKEAQQYLNDPEGSILLTSRDNLAEVVPRLSEKQKAKALLVCDEVHGMGSEGLVHALAGKLKPFGWTLGLSATPEREYDEQGNRFIEDEIGPTVFEFGLKKAIERQILCEFDYIDLEYEFSAADKDAVRQAIKRYHGKVAAGQAPSKETLYQDISRVAKRSREKLPQFQDLLSGSPDLLRRCVVFVEDAEYGFEVQKLLMPTGIDFHTYYAGDDRGNLSRFARGELDCLITCHRISEGIDIQSVNSIVLFSSSKARLETVQRLGRCLRIDPARPGKRATVIDFIRTDDIDQTDPDRDPTTDEERREWFRDLASVKGEE